MSLLIKNGLLYDGTPKPPSEQDILIQDGFIVEIDNFEDLRADEVINARGGIVAPGFIDINSGADHHLTLLSDSYQKEVLKQGVTTIVGGNSGISLSPFLVDSMDELLNSVGARDLGRLNIDWEYFDEFLESIEKRGCGVNFGSLVGYYNLDEIFDSDNFDELLEYLDEIISQGALGLSINLGSLKASSLDKSKLKDLGKVIAENNGLLSLSLRSPVGEVFESIKEVVEVVEDSGVSLEINNMQPIKAGVDEYRKGLKKLEEVSRDRNINFDCHPYPVTKLPIHKLLPEDLGGSLEGFKDKVQDEEAREEVVEYLKTKTRKTIELVHLPRDYGFLEGKTIKKVSQSFELNQAETLLEVMQLTSLKGMVLYSEVNESLLDEFLKSKTSIVASHGIHLERGTYTPFGELIEWAEANDFPLEKAINKITRKSAQKAGLNNRGLIKRGQRGDVTVIKNGEIRDVVVNGEVALKGGEIQKTLSGEVI